MALLKPATMQTAYLKIGMLGFEGSGKTYTACDIARGITKQVKGTKVAFFDTEKGSDFQINKFKDEGIQLDVIKSRAFTDLCTVIREAELGGYSFLVIDSISHVWRELCSSYLKKKNRSNLSMKDWGVLKAEWAQFTDLYVNSRIHIAMLGRAGFEYDITEDEDGKQEIAKSGTKMKVETETGFEPDLLLEMFTRKNDVSGAKASTLTNCCLVRKDRTDTMNGRIIEKPTYKSFLSVVNFLNLGGEHAGTDTSRTSAQLFTNPDLSWKEREVQRTILLEQLQESLTLLGLSGTGKDEVKKRTEYLLELFGTSSKTELEQKLSLEKLQSGVTAARQKAGVAKQEPSGQDVFKESANL